MTAIVCLTRLVRWRLWLGRQPWRTWRGTPGGLAKSRWGDARWVELSGRTEDGAEHRVLLRLVMGSRYSTGVTWSPDGQTVLYLPGPGRQGVILPASARQGRKVRRRMAR